MTKRLLSSLLMGLLAALVVGASQAIPFRYSESVAGDLPHVPSTAFLFGIGNNTISGTTHFAVNVHGEGPHFDADFDSFAFAVPTGLQLVAISLAFTTTSSNTVRADAELRLCPDVGECGLPPTDVVLGLQTVSFMDRSPLSVDFRGALPLSAGTYTLFTSGLGIGPVIDPSLSESWSADYRWTLRVIPVAEPGLIPLLGLALAGLVFTRRRKQ